MVAILNISVSALQPNELVLIYNQNDPRSQQLAEYYARIRQVSADRLCPVKLKVDQEEITREEYERAVRTPLRQFLREHEFGLQIRCLVLFYGMPLRIGAKRPNPAETQLAGRWEEQYRAGLLDLQRLSEILQGIAASQPATQAEPLPAKPDEASLPAQVRAFEQARANAWLRFAPHAGTPEGQVEYRRFVDVVQTAEGSLSLLAHTQRQDLPPEQVQALQKLSEQLKQAEQRIAELRELPLADPKREESRPLIQQNHGLIGRLASLLHDIAMTRTDETVSSLDSELTLAWWDDYPLYRWMPNPLNWRLRSDPAALAPLTARQRQQAVLMTSRIDGPSLTVARRLIDDAVAVEKRGLSGNVYIDARGLSEKDPHGPYDQDLRDLANLLWKKTRLPVRLDNRPALFPPGSCPDAMLYCGWYSVRRYVPSLRPVSGSVGFHIASFEAITIHTPGERGWVMNLLQDGMDATLGPVAEPYLHSFPKPTKFFGLLLTGRFTLAECYAYTNELNSWMMVLFGDPLYTPFAAVPQLRVEDVYPAEQIPAEFRAGAGKPIATTAPR